MSSAEELIDIETAHGSGAYRPRPLVMVRGAGTRLWDIEGREYLDCATGIGVAALGHAHPVLVQAIAEQAGRLITCAAGYYYNDLRARFLAKLTEITPPGLTRVFLSNSGAEAVEAAMKLARVCTGRPGIVAARGGFHGRTLGALSATWKAPYRRPFEPLVPGFSHVPFGDPEALTEAITDRTAAVLLEPVQGEAGIYPAPAGYLAEARRLCNQHDALLIFDEVQSGLGRSGKWFACEHYGVIPDVLCLAKALGGGVPLGATVFRRELSFEKGQHGSTFGGNPLACRAGLTVIEQIAENNLLDNVTQVGNYFLHGLQALAKTHPEKVREARGLGLMLALQLRGRAAPLLQGLQERGILALSAGPTTLRFLPPLIFTQAEAERVLSALAEVLA